MGQAPVSLCDMENNTAPAQVAKFIVGQTYSCRSACDRNCVWSFTVTARTAKRVTLTGNFCSGKKAQSKGVSVYDGREQIYPLGRYSMAPILNA